MKKTISTYWPVAILIPIALASYLHALSVTQPEAAPRQLMSAANVSAELARAVSFGYVEPEAGWIPATAMPSEAAPAPRVL
jgi:hypothetical protein